MLNRHVQRAGLVAGAIAAALLFFVAGAALRLLMGPISLGPFAGAIEDSLNRSISGLSIRFDEAVLEWSRAEGKVNLIILGTKVFDTSGRIVAQAPKADLDFRAADLLAGHLSLKRFALVGVQLTAVRSPEGQLRLGFGLDRSAGDLLETIRKVLQDSDTGGGSLESFSIADARLAFEDQGSGLFVVFPDAQFTLNNKNRQLDASLQSAVEISGYPARLMLNAILRDDGTPQEAMVEVKGLSFPALAKNSAHFDFLQPYQLTSDLVSSFSFGSNYDVQTAEFRVTGMGTVDTTLLDAPLALDQFTAEGKYDALANTLALDRFEFQSRTLSARASAALALTWKAGALTLVSGSADIKDAHVALPDLFQEPLSLARIQLTGSFDKAARKFAFERAHIEGGALNGDFAGAMTFADKAAPAVALSGSLNAIGVRDLLRYWPVGKAAGARDWIAENVPEGRIGPVRVELNAPTGAFDAETLPDNAVSVSFPFEALTARYIATMTPLTAARGEALLTGDNFHATIASAMVGPLPVSNGDVTIAQLHLPGSPGVIKAHTEGSVTNVLTLIDQQPLGYAKKFNILPGDAKGNAVVDLEIGLPMLRDLPVEQLRVGVQAKVADLAIPIDEKRRLERGAVSFAVTTSSLTSQGTGAISGAPVSFKWTEDFGAAANSTRIEMTGRLDDATRPGLGFAEPAWITGPMPMTAVLFGQRFHFTRATVKADLNAARIVFPVMKTEKRAGQAASATAVLQFLDDGAITVSDLAMNAEALALRGGGLQFDKSGKLVNVSFNAVQAGKDDDFALNLTPLTGGGYDIRVKGKSFDASRFLSDDKKKDAKAPETAEADTPMHDPLTLDAELERVAFHDGLAFKNVALAFAFGADERLNNLKLDATGPMKGKVTGRFAMAKGVRNVAFEAEDAEGVVRALTGFASLRGGSLAAKIAFPSDEAAKPANIDYTGTLVLEDFVVTDQPFLARLFAAGSLDGPLRLMQGQGIAISNFNAPFAARGKIVTIKDGRASGSAIGMTFDGMLDRRQDRIDVTGTLVPAYGLNSMLGNVPLLGDLLVSKPGEGVIGLTYAMKGNLGEPALTVNPLSVLTPGILRRLFEFAPAKAPPAPPPPQASAAPPGASTP
jgi:hypothetical protein